MNWFEQLCDENGLKALPAVKAGDAEVGKYFFTATGDPRRIDRIKRMARNRVKVTYARDDFWFDVFDADETISFYAEAK